jgi:nitronate monooxygenase
MLGTFLTQQWGLRYPIIGAPMAGVARGALARAISQAGGLGMIGIGSTASISAIEEEAATARGEDDTRFGLGLMVWAIERRPELLDAAVAANPFLLSLSFGSPAPYLDRVHAAGIFAATQVNSATAAHEAAAVGVDLIVAQGTEAGGHTGQISTLPLLQAILDAVETPVLAAGGIASPRGLAAVLAAGAQGAWVGTAFLAAFESAHGTEARRRILAARETDTVHTSVFDRVQGIPWPPGYPGRALRNRFADRWHPREAEVVESPEAHEEYERARASGDYDVAVIYAGQAVGLVNKERLAAEIVRDLCEGAEALLRRTLSATLAD